MEEHDSKGSYLYIAKIDANETISDAWEVVIGQLHRATVQRTTIVDKVAKELVKSMTSAIDSVKLKFESTLNEDNMRAEAKFKKFQRKIDPQGAAAASAR